MSAARRGTIAALTAFALGMVAGVAAAQQVEVLWLGHATFRFTSTTGKVIVIDPYLTTNPRTPTKYKDLAAVGKVDLILVTHGHRDHVTDVPELAKLTGATVVGPQGLINSMVALGLLEGSKAIAMDKGGTVTPLGAGIKVHMVPAEHSSSMDLKMLKSETAGPRFTEGGVPVGFVIEFENGFKIYDTGDTDVFSDMALINRFFKPDLALVCIGGHFTMDPEHAAYAVRELIRPKQVIPMHYGTFPVINHTVAEFRTALGDAPVKVLEMKPGDTLKF
jgi:L-ascorbate metabolism protein UlaG (beta-lactamase superfamily)